MKFENTLGFAKKLDKKDRLAKFRKTFHFPKVKKGKPLYFCGNSLGLEPKSVAQAIMQELRDWATFGVEGHFEAKNPWLPYHEFVSDSLARLVGAKSEEVVAMNSLTVNLHLLLASFYRPTAVRYRILIEEGAFPSDRYAVRSQARFHGFDPDTAIIGITPRPGETLIRDEDVIELLKREGRSISVVLLGQVNYLTGQAFGVEEITRVVHEQGCMMGVDLAHGAGNLHLKLHDWGVDFAAWCSYKYLNSGPGAIAGAFIHERHHGRGDLPRFEGWWGHDKATRFAMPEKFSGIPTAEAWQLSNPPIFQLAALQASLKIFDQAGGMVKLRAKGDLLTSYLEFVIDQLPRGEFTIITPREIKRRGSQLSLKIHKNAKAIQKTLVKKGVFCDFREPDVVRFAPVPLYNNFEDVFRLGQVLREAL